jgi:cytochrome P450
MADARASQLLAHLCPVSSDSNQQNTHSPSVEYYARLPQRSRAGAAIVTDMNEIRTALEAPAGVLSVEPPPELADLFDMARTERETSGDSSKYAEIELLRHWLVFKDAGAGSDGRHDAIRAKMAPAVTPERLEHLRGPIRAMIRDAIDRSCCESPTVGGARGTSGSVVSFDFQKAVANLVPVRVVHILIGLPVADAEMIYEHSLSIGRVLGGDYRLVAQPDRWKTLAFLSNALRHYDAYISRKIARAQAVMGGLSDAGGDGQNHYRADDDDDAQNSADTSDSSDSDAALRSGLLALLLRLESAGEVTMAEVRGQMMMLLFAGHETTAKLMGSTVALFCQNPEQWQILQGDRDLVPLAIEEANRLQGPVKFVGRGLVKEVVGNSGGNNGGSGGMNNGNNGRQPSSAENSVILSLSKANRDAARFGATASQFDVTRESARVHIGFGQGVHMCLGRNLARLEMHELLCEMLDRFESVRLASDGVQVHNSALFRAFDALPVVAALRK